MVLPYGENFIILT